MKRCSKCKKRKPNSRFGRDKHATDGLTYACKECRYAPLKALSDVKRREYHKQRNKKTVGYRKNYYGDQANKDKFRDRALRKEFGIGLADYNRLFEAQNGVCAICSNPQKSTRHIALCVDHDHDTGEIRGLLCSSCNRGLGLLRDSVSTLKLAIAYLERTKR